MEQVNTDLVSVRYIGKREEYTDGAYGTYIKFLQGQSKLVPADKAALMLKHKDVYEPGDSNAKMDRAEKKAKKADEAEANQDLYDTINAMDKAGLESYASTNYQIDLDRRKSVTDLRIQVTGLVDQYGPPPA